MLQHISEQLSIQDEPLLDFAINGSCLGVRVQLDRVWQSGTVLALAGFVFSLHACEFVFVYVCIYVCVCSCVCVFVGCN